MAKRKGFLICPVRGHEPGETLGVVTYLESLGWDIHWPHRDTDQVDAVGYRICSDNLKAMRESERVFVVWDGKSQGSLFDLGMAFALGRKLTVLEAPPETPGQKSFQNMMWCWHSAP